MYITHILQINPSGFLSMQTTHKVSQLNARNAIFRVKQLSKLQLGITVELTAPQTTHTHKVQRRQIQYFSGNPLQMPSQTVCQIAKDFVAHCMGKIFLNNFSPCFIALLLLWSRKGAAGKLGYLNLAVAQLFDVCSKINARISHTLQSSPPPSGPFPP